MIDITTDKRLIVLTDGDSAPYIMVPEKQLGVLERLLKKNGVRFWVDDEVISLDGKPEVAFVNLGHESDPQTVQQLLDTIP